MEAPIHPADLSKINRISIHDRENLVKIDQFMKVPGENLNIRDFMDALPQIKHRTNAATSILAIVKHIIEMKKHGQPITWALGPHVIKYGLSPLIIALMDMGLIQCIITNGAGAIHDVEIAMIGETSEEMQGHISSGDFGMAKETGEFINHATQTAFKSKNGLGFELGMSVLNQNLRYQEYSLLGQAAKRQIPMTVHVAIGTDIVHMHPDMDGAATGAATFTDFRIFCQVLRDFRHGGVHLNIGSTVILPEVFVKAMTVANNLNRQPAKSYVTANFDHLSEYRPLMNVVHRGSYGGGEGFEIIGRMELMIPLLFIMLRDEYTHSL